MTEMSRKRKYLSRASTVSQRLLRQSRTLGRETRGTDFLSRLYSIQLLAWKPCAYESHSSRYGSNAFTATSAVEGRVFWMNACRWGDLSIALASHGATRLISSYESSPARKTTGAVETRPRKSAQGMTAGDGEGGRRTEPEQEEDASSGRDEDVPHPSVALRFTNVGPDD